MTVAAKIRELNFAKLQHININPCQINQLGEPAKWPEVWLLPIVLHFPSKTRAGFIPVRN